MSPVHILIYLRLVWYYPPVYALVSDMACSFEIHEFLNSPRYSTCSFLLVLLAFIRVVRTLFGSKKALSLSAICCLSHVKREDVYGQCLYVHSRVEMECGDNHCHTLISPNTSCLEVPCNHTIKSETLTGRIRPWQTFGEADENILKWLCNSVAQSYHSAVDTCTKMQ